MNINYDRIKIFVDLYAIDFLIGSILSSFINATCVLMIC